MAQVIWAYFTRSNGGKVTLLNLQRGNQEDFWRRWPLLKVPLATVSTPRKCGNIIQCQRREEIFSTWRKLWTWLEKAEKVGIQLEAPAQLPAGNQCHWSAVVLVCVPKTLTQSHTLACTHTVSSQNKSVTELELGLNQSMTLSWGWDLELKMKTKWQDWQRHAHGYNYFIRWY